MKIGTVDITREVLVIAEIGNNHEGDVARAIELIGRAAEAGAQAVKFQTILPEQLVAPDQVARLEQLRRYALSAEQHAQLANVAEQAGVMFMSTPFAIDAVEMLRPHVPAFKIASGDNDFYPLLRAVAATGKPILLSTGMADLTGIKAAKAVIEGEWGRHGYNASLVILHCVSAYPTSPDEANLSAIRTLATLGCPVGYSDHTLGSLASVVAVGLGARVIEKHFTLSKTLSDFRDHKLSANPAEMKELVELVREANVLLGDGQKRLIPSERATADAARRSLAAKRDLDQGHIIAAHDITWLRPGGGISPGSESAVLGRVMRRATKAGSRIVMEDLE